MKKLLHSTTRGNLFRFFIKYIVPVAGIVFGAGIVYGLNSISPKNIAPGLFGTWAIILVMYALGTQTINIYKKQAVDDDWESTKGLAWFGLTISIIIGILGFLLVAPYVR